MSTATDPLASITDAVYERLAIRGLPAKRLYSALEAAGYLSISLTTVRRLVRDGELQTVDLGTSNLLIAVEDLNRFVEERKK